MLAQVLPRAAGILSIFNHKSRNEPWLQFRVKGLAVGRTTLPVATSDWLAGNTSVTPQRDAIQTEALPGGITTVDSALSCYNQQFPVTSIMRHT
jgi:hypothetical protein